MTRLQDREYLDVVRRETNLLATTQPERIIDQVPHIDGWTVGTVIGHTGWVARYVTLALASTPDDPPRRSSVPEPPLGEDVFPWFNDAKDALLTTLETTDLATTRPTFTGPQPAGWWLRRLAHETAMHRWDAEASSGSPAPIAAALARDGINEVFEVFATTRLDVEALGGAGETMHLHATDIDDGEWMVTFNEDALEWTHAHAKADVAVRGTASDLLLMLWGRIPPSVLEVFGDASLLSKWQTAATF
ncbi:MAG: maleylpyruvate isomerase family mycothiol-dependent enzyme [Acidimicrobiales bacterium]